MMHSETGRRAWDGEIRLWRAASHPIIAGCPIWRVPTSSTTERVVSMGCSLYMAHVARGHIYTSPPKSASSFCFFIVRKRGWWEEELLVERQRCVHYFVRSYWRLTLIVPRSVLAASNRVHLTWFLTPSCGDSSSIAILVLLQLHFVRKYYGLHLTTN